MLDFTEKAIKFMLFMTTIGKNQKKFLNQAKQDLL